MGVNGFKSEKFTPQSVKSQYRSDGHFFEEATMEFFGDRMSSYRCVRIDGTEYMIRTPDSTVNVFGRKQRAGREFFGCWEIDDTGDELDVDTTDEETKDMVYDMLYGN